MAKEIKSDLQLKSDIFPWITDEGVRNFFAREGRIEDEGNRLSASAGKGLY
jgi:hypothetical protein